MLEQEINIDNYKILRCDRNRFGGGVACYIRNDFNYNILPVFPREIKNIFFEILLPNSKPVTVGTIYRPPSQNDFLELLNSDMNKIYSVDNEIYILDDFNINLFLNNILNSKSIPNDVKIYHEFKIYQATRKESPNVVL